MRIATAFFLLIVLVLVVFGLCGYLLKEVDAEHDLFTSEQEKTVMCQGENANLQQSLVDLQAKYQSNVSAYNDLKAKYYALLSSPFTTRETTPAVMTGSLIFGGILTLGLTRFMKTTNPTPRSQIVTRQGAKSNQITITMSAQTYENFQKYLQRPNK